MAKRRPPPPAPPEPLGEEPYRQMWRRLSPAERMIRSLRLRKRVRNVQALHDAKTLPGS